MIRLRRCRVHLWLLEECLGFLHGLKGFAQVSFLRFLGSDLDGTNASKSSGLLSLGLLYTPHSPDCKALSPNLNQTLTPFFETILKTSLGLN